MKEQYFEDWMKFVTKLHILKGIAAFAAILLVFSCSNKVEIERFEGSSEINSGETATLDWKFRKADYVLIDGFKDQMPPEGTLKVKTDKTKTYKFTAINYFDTLSTEWKVNVAQSIRTGAESSAFPEMKESYKASEYLTGIASATADSRPDRIKVMRKFDKGENSSDYSIRFIVLDKYGNYLRPQSSKGFKVGLTSIDGSSSFETNMISEKWTSNPEKTLNISILADNSAAAERNNEVAESIKSFADHFRMVDKFSFAWFNHSLGSLVSNDGGFDLMKNIPEPNPEGFNSVFRHSFDLLSSNNFQKQNELQNIMILILFSSDNSSIFYDAEDVAELAKTTKTVIYPIAIGTAFSSHSLRYLADYTGGRFYVLDENNIDQVGAIIREIIFSQKSYFDLRFKGYEDFSNKTITLNLQDKERTLIDNFKIISTPEPQFADYQAVAGFGFKDTTIAVSYFENIKTLAYLLNTNPSITVELSGHSGIEGNEAVIYQLALERAQNVRRLLIAEKVNPSQIRVVSEGRSKPVYYLEQMPWQSFYNRRVEVRWIVPEQLPYEILAEVCPSEEVALSKVETWEKIGYKAYYERFLKNNNPTYRVKIWGYATESEAESIAVKLRKKYKTEFEVR